MPENTRIRGDESDVQTEQPAPPAAPVDRKLNKRSEVAQAQRGHPELNLDTDEPPDRND
jgi:hypothetical protein